MCQGFNYVLGFLHHFVLAKLATSSIRVKAVTAQFPRLLNQGDSPSESGKCYGAVICSLKGKVRRGYMLVHFLM